MYSNYKDFNWKEFGITLLVVPFIMPAITILYYTYRDNKDTIAALNNELNKHAELEKIRAEKATEKEVVRNG